MISMAPKGKLIVIDGTDGSGKGTQSAKLIDRLIRDGKRAQLTDFPQYGQSSAYFVEKYLRGEYGTMQEVGPERASFFYALDRYDASFKMREWLEAGTTIVSNRYTSSNMGHQAGNVTDAKKRDQLISWIKDLEYNIFGIPVPDANILLYMPPEIGQQLVDKKLERDYTKGKKRDLLEADLAHLKRASDAYLEVAKKEDWDVIYCVEKDGVTVRDREAIHEELYQLLKRRAVV